MTEITEAEYQRRKAIYDGFMPAWDEQRKIQLAAEERFNKCVFAIAAGSFGVSFAFISQLVPNPLEREGQSIFLVIAWLFMGFAIILNIIDSRITFKIQDKLLDNIELNIQKGYDGKPYVDASKKGIELPTRIFKWVMLGCVSIGIISLLYFVFSFIKL